MKLPEEASRTPDIVLVCKPTVCRLVLCKLLHAELSGLMCKIILVVFTRNFTILLSVDLFENCIHWNINIVLKLEDVFSGEFQPVTTGITRQQK